MNSLALSSRSPDASPPLASSQGAPSPEFAAQNLSQETGDSDLVERSRAGDLDAFDILVERHQSRIFNVCYRMLGNRDEAADSAQDAFVRAFRSLEKFRGDSAFGTWLHRIAVRVALDAITRRKRAPLPYSDLKPSGDDERDDPEPNRSTPHGSTPPDADSAHSSDPAHWALRQERKNAVRGALADLPQHYRIVLVLFDIEGYSYEEIAQTLEMPLGTIKSRISRARLALRERLEVSRELFED